MIEIVRPAPLGDTLALAFRTGMAPRRHLQAMILQVVAQESFGFLHDGRLIMAFGVWPLEAEDPGERLVEFWLAIGAEAVPHLPTLVRLARLVFARLGQSEPVKLRAHVHAGHRPGQRLATLVGMRLIRIEQEIEIWECRHEQVH
jgi:hypothetical protein